MELFGKDFPPFQPGNNKGGVGSFLGEKLGRLISSSSKVFILFQSDATKRKESDIFWEKS